MTRAPERVERLVHEISDQRGTIIIPTPALSEFLVSAGDASGSYLDEVQGSRVFQVPPFDVKAAAEAASATRAALGRGDKRSGATGAWQKVKVDRQIVAVAKVHGARILYSDDADVRTLGAESGILVVNTGELPLPRRLLEP